MESYEIVYVHIFEAGCIVFFLQYPVILLFGRVWVSVVEDNGILYCFVSH